jgi:hypothetical protein
MDDLFDEVQAVIDTGYASLELEVDPETGALVRYWVDVDERMADEEHGVEVMSLTFDEGVEAPTAKIDSAALVEDHPCGFATGEVDEGTEHEEHEQQLHGEERQQQQTGEGAGAGEESGHRHAGCEQEKSREGEASTTKSEHGCVLLAIADGMLGSILQSRCGGVVNGPRRLGGDAAVLMTASADATPPSAATQP